MLFRHAGIASGSLGRFTGLVVPRQCCCRAKRGRPRRTEDTAEFDEFQQPVETAIRGAPRRRGRPGKTDVQADEPLATSQQGLVSSISPRVGTHKSLYHCKACEVLVLCRSQTSWQSALFPCSSLACKHTVQDWGAAVWSSLQPPAGVHSSCAT